MADPEGSTGSGSSGGWSRWGGGHGWGGRRRGGPTRRPPWWPQDEPFPPQGRPGPEAWRAMRGRFVRRAVLFLAIVIVLLSVVIALVIDLIEAAERIEAGDYAVRVPERGPREVRSLARAFNAMSARLEATEAE